MSHLFLSNLYLAKMICLNCKYPPQVTTTTLPKRAPFIIFKGLIDKWNDNPPDEISSSHRFLAREIHAPIFQSDSQPT